MRSYPLIRSKWSNEHIMAGLFFVILLYMLPRWLQYPIDIAVFAAMLAFALVLDATAAFIRHKRVVCSVSAAITAAVLYVLTPGVPLWAKLIGVFAAIIPGKQFWGGTGKNAMNPAIFGYVIICTFYTGIQVPIQPTNLLIPAVILSLPFILFRPFISFGYFTGILIAGLTGNISFGEQLIMNSVFICCIILTDPVTVTPLKLTGLVGGFLCAFLPLMTIDNYITGFLTILIFNLVSHLLAEYIHTPRKRPFFTPISIKKPYRQNDITKTALELNDAQSDVINTGCNVTDIPENIDIGYLIGKLDKCGVYGMGGAAFPTGRKLQTILDSNVDKKFFIINAAECDPGLLHDKWLLHNRQDDIFKGISIITKCLHFSKVIIAVKESYGIKPPEGISISKVRNYYPAGFEKNLIKSVLKKSVPSGFIPAKLGILVLNVQTVFSVYEAVCLNRKADSKYITIADITAGYSVVAKVKTDTSVMEAINKVYPDRRTVFIGGGIMQARMAQEDDKIGKDTNIIIAAPIPRYKESPLCSKCGACVCNCPEGLQANRIADLVDKGCPEAARKYSPELCIKCGLCSYICPAGRNLSARVWEAKEAITVSH